MNAVRAQTRPRHPQASSRARWLSWEVLIPGVVLLALMLVWAEHDGGYDEDTWYWGALALLSLVTALLVIGRSFALPRARSFRLALGAFGGYVAWSYVSILWAQAPGAALSGSNRALMYLLLFVAFSLLPWRSSSATLALVGFAVGVGAIAAVMLVDLATGSGVSAMFSDGRLLAPTGYFNAAAALFTMTALLAVGILSINSVSALLRGLLVAIAVGCLQLAVLAQSRGWLFTLPLVLIAGAVVIRSRLRLVPYVVLVGGLVLVNLRRLLDVYNANGPTALSHAAEHAGRPGLALCAGGLVAGTVLALIERRVPPGRASARLRRSLGAAMIVLALAAGVAGGLAATHGHPLRFVSRQWHGFTHPSPTTATSSHFAQVGSGRYDFWRVALDAFLHAPVGGLGQDNFGDYYLLHRRTSQEPSWPHSLELRMLSSTGVVGAALFALFLLAALWTAARTRLRSSPLRRAVAGAALLPLIVWVIHGSVDWFWEIPALSAPALGFLALAAALGERERVHGGLGAPLEDRAVPMDTTAVDEGPRPAPDENGDGQQGIIWQPAPTARLSGRDLGPSRGRSGLVGPARVLRGALAVLAVVAAAVLLGFPYLAVRETSVASDIGLGNPGQALHDLSIAADLNPLDSAPGRIGGWIALQANEPREAAARFAQSLAREHEDWFAWLGEGLAASVLGQRSEARADFERAVAIDNHQPAAQEALARVDGPHPLTPAQAAQTFVLVQ